MKAYIASNKPKNKDVEVEECRGNLAWTTSCLSDSKSLSSSVLFFVLDPSMNLSEDSAEKIGLRCIICNTVICMEVMRNGNPSRNTHVLSSHLSRQHNDLASLVESRYPTMGHLLSELDWNRLSCKSTFSSTTQKNIHTYYVRRDEIPDEVEGVSNHDVGIEPSQEKKRLVIVPDPLTRKRNKAVLAAVVLGIPLSWDVNKEPEYKELIKVLNVPSYYHIGKTLSDMTRQYQTCVKKCLQDYPFLSLCCGGWSVVKPAKSMEVFYATVFKGDEFKSILVDCVPMDRSTANDLVDTLERIRSEYRLPSNTMITTDGASNNKKAFEGQRAVCSAHAINTVIAHMTSNCRHYEGKKNGITFNDLKAIREHFNRVNAVCTYASAICMCLGKEAEKMREEYNKLRDKKNAFDRLLERKMVQLEAMVEAVKRDQEEKRVSDMEMYGIKDMETIEVDDSDVSDEEESGKDVEQFTITEREYVSTYSQLYSLTPLIKLCHVGDLGGLRNPIECLAELVLSVSATEAVCERFFRQASLTVKRQYVTNMNNETVRSVAMIKYNRDVFDAICYGRDVLSVLSFVC